MMLILARLISLIANPLFVLIPLPFLLIYKTTGNINYALQWTYYSFIFIFLVVAFVLYAVKKGMFTDFDVSKREQRPMLFSVTILIGLCYIIGLYMFHGPLILFITIFGIIAGVFIASIVNTQIKASIHVATISAVTSAVSIIYGGKYWLLLILIPIVGWSRVKIKRHTVLETIIGGILGSSLSASIYGLAKVLLH